MKKFDAITICSGQAGTPLVFRLAKAGMKVAFNEKQHLGGTCPNVGCTPTKTSVASARLMWDAHNSEDLGIEIPEGTVANMKKIKARKDALIKKSVDQITKSVKENENITYIKGEAKFKETKVIEVNDTLLTAPEIYINVGGRPFIPKDSEKTCYLTNESLLELNEIPEHLLIIGGSYIGLESGQMFKRFGSQVSIFERGGRIIHREDEKTSNAIHKFFEVEGVSFDLNKECISGKRENENSVSVSAKGSDGKEIKVTGSHLLLAVGRRLNTDILGLENTGIKINERGFIIVNDHLKTIAEEIYNLDDCNGQGAFTHTAYNAYEIIAGNKFNGKDRKVSDRTLTYDLL